jgi:hypothetical protein
VRGETIQALAAAALLSGLPACSGNNICGERREVLLRANGESFPCMLASDCPRPGLALICLSDNPPTQECVRCVEPPGPDGGAVSVCMLSIPESCQ